MSVAPFFVKTRAVHFSMRKCSAESIKDPLESGISCCSITHFSFSTNIAVHDIPWSGQCLLFLTIYCNTSRPTHIWFSLLRFQKHSRCTLWEKMRPEKNSGESFKAVQRSILQKQILFSLPTQASLIKKHVKGNWVDAFFFFLFFNLAYYFSLIKCVSLTRLPTTTNPPNSWLYYIKENWERMARDRVPYWINLSFRRILGFSWCVWSGWRRV